MLLKLLTLEALQIKIVSSSRPHNLTRVKMNYIMYNLKQNISQSIKCNVHLSFKLCYL